MLLCYLRGECMQLGRGACCKQCAVKVNKIILVKQSLVCSPHIASMSTCQNWSIVRRKQQVVCIPLEYVNGHSCHEHYHSKNSCTQEMHLYYPPFTRARTQRSTNIQTFLTQYAHGSKPYSDLSICSEQIRVAVAACLMTGSYLVTPCLPISGGLAAMRLRWSSSSSSSWINIPFRHCEVRISALDGRWLLTNTNWRLAIIIVVLPLFSPLSSPRKI